MAVWQYDVRLIPENAIRMKVGRIPSDLQPDLTDVDDWWRGVSPPSEDEFSALAPSGESWTEAIRVWGSEDSDRVECHFDEGELWDVRFRIDIRKLSKTFVLGLLDLAHRHQLLLTTDSGRLFRPTLDALVLDMQESTSFAFVSDPEGFLIDLSSRQLEQ